MSRLHKSVWNRANWTDLVWIAALVTVPSWGGCESLADLQGSEPKETATDYKIQDNRLWISHPSGNYMVCDWLQNTRQPSLNQPSEWKLHGLRLTTKYRTTVFESAIRAEITWSATDYKIQDNRLWISHPSGNYMVCDWLQNTGQPSLN